VLAGDPSSTVTGGAILGDKTRMDTLVRNPGAFIRPSPSGGSLGGVAQRTRETIALCEAAGFDRVIVETVGVGQSEIAVSRMTDVFLLLLAPAGGDELQGVKRGIMEMADLIVVNKADGDLAATAQRTRADYAGALRLMRRKDGDAVGFPMAVTASSIEGRGIAEVADLIEQLTEARHASGYHLRQRRRQAVSWMETALEAQLQRAFGNAVSADEMTETKAAVEEGTLSPEAAADHLIGLFRAAMRQ
jgi:LAO/AO transport system kinase